MSRPMRYLGTWCLPSGIQLDVHLELDPAHPRLHYAWSPHPPAWSHMDREHYATVTRVAIVNTLEVVQREQGQAW